MRYLAITGPRSTRGHVDAFQAAAPPGSLDILESPSLDEVRTRTSNSGYAAIILFGGDGTLNRHLGILRETRVAVLMVPSGSGNDFAMANGIFTAADALQAFQALQRGDVPIRDVDLGCARFADGSERLFSCCLNVGVDADAARRSNALPNFFKERKGYMIGGALAILFYEPQRIAISGDGIPPLNERGWFAAVSNTPTYGGGLKIAPQASITDGMLDVTYLRPLSRLQLLRHFPKVLSGAHIGLRPLVIMKTTELHIATDAPMPIFADGEPFGATPVTITAVPNAIRAVMGKSY
jgi:diacylglycerol kinase (ATP)